MSQSDKAPSTELDYVELTADQQRQRKQRSLAIAALLAALVVLFYIVTMIKMSPMV